MKLTMLSILTVLLVASLAAPAAAATLPASGTFIADVISTGNLTNFDVVCGKALISISTTGGITNTTVLYSVDFTTGNCSAANVPGVVAGNSFDLCRVGFGPDAVNGQSTLLSVINDANHNGKIDGVEGILKGFLPSGVNGTVLLLDLVHPAGSNCTGTILYRTGFRSP